MYIHYTDRLWSEGVTDIKFGEDKLITTVSNAVETVVRPGPKLQS